MARPKGSKNKPQFHTYVDERDRKEFVQWVRENYKTNNDLAKWMGDQMFGKAPTTFEDTDGEGVLPLLVKIIGDEGDADSNR
jgi:hypothetical protein